MAQAGTAHGSEGPHKLRAYGDTRVYTATSSFSRRSGSPPSHRLTHLQIEGKAAHLGCVTISMSVMSAGDGYDYLLRSVAAGDGDRSLSTPLTRYYAEVGTPPGRWLGSGLAGLGDGQLSSGDQVTEAQLGRLIGAGCDPKTGEQLGRAYPVYKSTEERVAGRVKGLSAGLSQEERAAETARIEAEEAATSGRRPVAAYDFTFSVPKSVSALWGVADANLQEMIVATHHAAVVEVLDFMEREVAATRTGVAAGDGAVAQVAVNGLIAAAFDHWDSRAGDPQLHTHVVISNKVQTVLDGRWRSLDGRPMHAAVTAISAYYDAVLADRLTGVFGFGWEGRMRGSNMHPHGEIVGVPEKLVGEFSSRTRDIDREADRLIAEYVQAHGRRAPDATRIKLRAQATLATRPEKQIRSLLDLTTDWRARAKTLLGEDATAWARRIATNPAASTVDPGSVPDEVVADLGARVMAQVEEKRTTWRHWNLWGEASRQTMGWRFATAGDREVLVARVAAAAERASVALTPPELTPTPPEFQREDGTSVLRPRHATVYSSEGLLAAEDRLMARAGDLTAATVAPKHVATATRSTRQRTRLSEEQVAAIEQITSSGRQVDVLVGAAGTGKTTTMRGLRAAWERAYGRGSVVGLAPSAAAADVLAQDLGIRCENTAKWLHEHDFGTGDHMLKSAQLVILDEASMADTRTLDRLTGIAADAGAKALLVGDPAQLAAVDAGGAFALLASARPDVPTLTDIHRFTHKWEKHASLSLRDSRTDAISTYARHDRLRDGTTEDMLEAAYTAWRRDLDLGLASLLVTESTETVYALNARARADRILNGDTRATREAPLAGGAASVGDLVITRCNDRRLRTLSGAWVRNGDRWTVLEVGKDGSLDVRRHNGRPATLTLPPEYVAEHVDLGYAITAHRAQGITADTAHVLVSARTTRENLYVSMTRGRHANTAYVAVDQPDDAHRTPSDDDVTAGTVLVGVLVHSDAELSAHQTIEAEHETYASIAQLAAEYETIAAVAQRPRWTALIRASRLPLDLAEAVITSVAFGPLTAALRFAEACGLDQMLQTAIQRGSLVGAVDPAAVLHHRVGRGVKGHHPTRDRLIVGLIPEAAGPMTAEHRAALTGRADLITKRAMTQAYAAVRSRAAWVNFVCEPPDDHQKHAEWLSDLATIAAYRDRYHITSNRPLGPPATSLAQRADAARAQAALQRVSAAPAEVERMVVAAEGLQKGSHLRSRI